MAFLSAAEDEDRSGLLVAEWFTAYRGGIYRCFSAPAWAPSPSSPPC